MRNREGENLFIRGGSIKEYKGRTDIKYSTFLSFFFIYFSHGIEGCIRLYVIVCA